MSERAEKLAVYLLEEGPADPQAVAQELGIRFDGEQDWHSQGKLWAFSDHNPDSPTFTITFYTRVGATRTEIARRWAEKQLADVEANTPRPKASFYPSYGGPSNA